MKGVILIIGSVNTTIRTKKNDNIRSAMGCIHIFVLLGYDIGPFILYDQQEGIALKVLDLEFKSALGVSFSLRLNRAADPDNGVHRGGDVLIGRNQARYFSCFTGLKLIEQGDEESYDCNGRRN
jgi:hypothetical protein